MNSKNVAKDAGKSAVKPSSGARAVKQNKSDVTKESGPQKDATVERAGHGGASQQAGGPEQHGGDAHEDRNP